MFLTTAAGRTASIAASITSASRTGFRSRRIFPLMMRDTSSRSSTRRACALVLRSIASRACAARVGSSVPRLSWITHARIGVSGVRSSCERVARNSSFRRFDSSALRYSRAYSIPSPIRSATTWRSWASPRLNCRRWSAPTWSTPITRPSKRIGTPRSERMPFSRRIGFTTFARSTSSTKMGRFSAATRPAKPTPTGMRTPGHGGRQYVPSPLAGEARFETPRHQSAQAVDDRPAPRIRAEDAHEVPARRGQPRDLAAVPPLLAHWTDGEETHSPPPEFVDPSLRIARLRGNVDHLVGEVLAVEDVAARAEDVPDGLAWAEVGGDELRGASVHPRSLDVAAGPHPERPRSDRHAEEHAGDGRGHWIRGTTNRGNRCDSGEGDGCGTGHDRARHRRDHGGKAEDDADAHTAGGEPARAEGAQNGQHPEERKRVAEGLPRPRAQAGRRSVSAAEGRGAVRRP